MNKKAYSIWLIIIILAFVLLAINFGIMGSIVMGTTQINCQDHDSDSWTCSPRGRGDFVFGGTPNTINIHQIDGTTKQSDRQRAICAKIDGGCPFLDSEFWSERLQYSDHVKTKLGKQAIIIKGYTEDNTYFETYGLGYAEDRSFKVEDPFSDQPKLKLTVSTITIHFKQGGYTEQEAKLLTTSAQLEPTTEPEETPIETEDIISESPAPQTQPLSQLPSSEPESQSTIQKINTWIDNLFKKILGVFGL